MSTHFGGDVQAGSTDGVAGEKVADSEPHLVLHFVEGCSIHVPVARLKRPLYGSS